MRRGRRPWAVWMVFWRWKKRLRVFRRRRLDRENKCFFFFLLSLSCSFFSDLLDCVTAVSAAEPRHREVFFRGRRGWTRGGGKELSKGRKVDVFFFKEKEFFEVRAPRLNEHYFFSFSLFGLLTSKTPLSFPPWCSSPTSSGRSARTSCS